MTFEKWFEQHGWAFIHVPDEHVRNIWDAAQQAALESSDDPVAWMANNLNDYSQLYWDKQEAIDDGCAYIDPLYTRPAPAQKPMSDEEIDDGLNEFVKWLKAQDPNIIRDPFSAAAGWAAGQRAERERIKKIIYEATDCGRGNYELLIERIGE